MRAYKLKLGSTVVAYVRSFAVAEESIRISYSAYPNVTLESKLISITVKRPGFDDVEYTLEPIDILCIGEHL